MKTIELKVHGITETEVKKEEVDANSEEMMMEYVAVLQSEKEERQIMLSISDRDAVVLSHLIEEEDFPIVSLQDFIESLIKATKSESESFLIHGFENNYFKACLTGKFGSETTLQIPPGAGLVLAYKLKLKIHIKEELFKNLSVKIDLMEEKSIEDEPIDYMDNLDSVSTKRLKELYKSKEEEGKYEDMGKIYAELNERGEEP